MDSGRWAVAGEQWLVSSEQGVSVARTLVRAQRDIPKARLADIVMSEPRAVATGLLKAPEEKTI